ncbi:bile acid:sodium symporter [Cyanobium sp. ATX 6A2]|nr:bile acid:sodium symporter [Cyanobium sp. ATX 6A2]
MALLVPLTLFTVMLALGVNLPLQAFQHWRRHWPLILRAQLATCLLVPLVGWLLLSLPPAQALSIEARHAIALMAACPSAPLILRKAGKSGGDASLAALLQVCAAVLAIVTLPLLADLSGPVFAVQGWDLLLPRQVALQVGQVQLLPLLLGLALGHLLSERRQGLRRVLDRLANGLLVLLVLAVLVRTAPLLLQFSSANLGAIGVMVLLVLVSLMLGYGLAGGEGTQSGQRVTVALVTSMRNPGLALLLATTYAPEMPAVKLGIIVYVLVTVLVSLPVLRWQRRTLQPH